MQSVEFFMRELHECYSLFWTIFVIAGRAILKRFLVVLSTQLGIEFEKLKYLSYNLLLYSSIEIHKYKLYVHNQRRLCIS